MVDGGGQEESGSLRDVRSKGYGMLPKINPTRTKSWKKLKEHYRVMKNRKMLDLFHQDPERFSRFSVTLEDMLVDYSKNIMTKETFRLLLGLARECKLKRPSRGCLQGMRSTRPKSVRSFKPPEEIPST